MGVMLGATPEASESEGDDDAPGNRSATMPLNSGTSFLRNLHRLTLMMDLSINTNSSSFGNLCFRLAAGRHTAAERRMRAAC